MPRKNWMPENVFENIQALAEQSRAPRRQTRAQVEKVKKAILRNKKARQRAATDRYYANRPKRQVNAPLGRRWRDRCVLAMDPGRWYSDRDLQNAMQAEEDHPVQVDALKHGLIEKRRNPEHKKERLPGGTLAIEEPRYLYALTPLGVALKAVCDLVS